jgi:Nif-specific regulatory protein
MSDRLRHERDLYVLVLELEGAGPERLQGLLEKLVEATNAQRAYLELHDGDAAPVWSMSVGCDAKDEEKIRGVTSKGIIAEAAASGRTVHTPFAMLDPRFQASKSVRGMGLEAVLCVPLGQGGVLYLEGKRAGGPFVDDDIKLVERLAAHVAGPVQRAVRAHRQRQQDDPTAPFRKKLDLAAIAGSSAGLARVFETVALAAPLDVTVLITGPNGTGKTQVARAIHDNSPRKKGPFVELNCAAIPEGLIESELFGTLPSAFPGARRTEGKVAAADGGTLFLDEIVEIPFAAQGKLLQLLQSRQYYPLAGTTLETANIRILAATNADIPALVQQKRFREDLYYRINVVTLRMPSLNERKDDLPGLVEALLARIAQEHNLPPRKAAPSLLAAVAQMEWPGNVRQLRNRLEMAVIRANGEASLHVEPRHVEGAPLAAGVAETFQDATRAFQRELLLRELKAGAWNVSAVARKLDLTRSHVYNLIKTFDLKES